MMAFGEKTKKNRRIFFMEQGEQRLQEGQAPNSINAVKEKKKKRRKRTNIVSTSLGRKGGAGPFL